MAAPLVNVARSESKRMDPLRKVRIGRSSLQVTRLGLGGAPLGGLYKDMSEASVLAVVQRVFELGLNLFDTAPFYGHGKSEMRLGGALASQPRDSFVLATKVGFLLEPQGPGKVESAFFENPAPFLPVYDCSSGAVMRSFEESLNRLRLERVDILNLHDPDECYEQAVREACPVLFRLRSEGRIQAVGAAMNQAEMLARFARESDFDCFLLAGRYTLIDHAGLKELLPLCVERHISVIIGGPFNSGILATGAQAGAKFNYKDAPPELVERVRQIELVCSRFGVPLKAAALQFPLAHPAVAAVIPGCRSVEELDENFRLMSQAIPGGFWEELRARKLLPSEAPVPGEE